LNFFRWFLARFLIPKADRLRVVSLTIKNYILSQFKYPINKISVLPVIVDIEKIKNQLPKIDIKEKYPGHDFYFLTAARLVKFKNISLQLKVIAKLIAEFPNTLLLIVGDGPEKKKLEKISKHLNIEKNVIFESWQKDIISYMKTADCFLFSSNYEGYGRTIIESLSSGLSVIATKVGIAPEVIQDGKNGYLVNVGNIEEYYKACKKIIQSPIKKEQVLDVNFPILKKEEYLKNYQTIFTI
jgi:glycosyltransferase involved in cell wall biosynthesis